MRYDYEAHARALYAELIDLRAPADSDCSLFLSLLWGNATWWICAGFTMGLLDSTWTCCNAIVADHVACAKLSAARDDDDDDDNEQQCAASRAGTVLCGPRQPGRVSRVFAQFRGRVGDPSPTDIYRRNPPRGATAARGCTVPATPPPAPPA